MADGATTKELRTRRSRRPALAPDEERSVTDRILDSAELVLRRHGYAGFTTRRVAEAAGIAPGNLSYHYPTKLELLRALITRLMTVYSGRFQEALKQPGRGLEDTVRWLLAESFTEEISSLFRELWAMSLRDEVVRKAVDDFYDQVIGSVEAALLAAHPTTKPQDVHDLVQLLAVISEGSAVIYGTRRSTSEAHARMVDLAIRLIGVIAPEVAVTSNNPSNQT